MIEQKFDFFKKQQSLKTNEKLLKQLKKVTKKDKKQKLNAQGKTFLHQHLLEYHYKYSVMLNGNLEFFLNSTKIFFFHTKTRQNKCVRQIYSFTKQVVYTDKMNMKSTLKFASISHR